MPIAPKTSIKGELIAMRSHRTEIRTEKAGGCFAEPGNFPVFRVEGLHDPVAGDAFVQNVLNFRQLVLAMPRGVTHARTDLARREHNHGDEQKQYPRKISAQNHDQAAVKMKVKNCCRNSASTVDMAYCTRSTSLMMVESSVPVVCLEKNAAERRSRRGVKIVAQIGDHAEAGIVHEIRAGIVADSLDDGGCNQGKRDNGPGIGKARRHELLQVHRIVREGIEEELNFLRSGCGIEHPIEDRTDQQILESIEAAHRGHAAEPKTGSATSAAARSESAASVAAWGSGGAGRNRLLPVEWAWVQGPILLESAI